MPQPHHPACDPHEHRAHRRTFLGTMGLGTSAVVANMNPWTGLCSTAAAQQSKQKSKALIFLWLQGGWSQFETWDPKPGTRNGGPYLSIPTSVPGTHISELLPRTAEIADRIAIIRSISNSGFDGGHDGPSPLTGRKQPRNTRYPSLADIATHALHQADSKVPYHVELEVTDLFRWETKRGPVSYLGPKVSPILMLGGKRPENFDRHPALTGQDHHDRELLRSLLDKNFQRQHETSRTRSYSQTHARVRGVMACDELLDIDKASQKDLVRYGQSTLARHCMQAVRLVEAGVSVVKVRHPWWDTHGDSWARQHRLCADFDHAFATMISDLEERGLLDSTLVVTLSEFGRTPKIDGILQRSHYPTSWSAAVAGCGITGGAVYGKTDDKGSGKIIDGKASPADLFATYFHALGIDPHENYYIDGRPVPLLETGGQVIEPLFT